MTRSLRSWNFAVEWILTSFHPNGDQDVDDDGDDDNDGGTAGGDDDDGNGDDVGAVDDDGISSQLLEDLADDEDDDGVRKRLQSRRSNVVGLVFGCPRCILGTDGSSLVVSMATVADESVRAVTFLVNFVTASPQRQFQDGSDPGTFGILGDGFVTGWTGADAIQADRTPLAVEVPPASFLPDVQSSASDSILFVAIFAATRGSQRLVGLATAPIG